jgi:hypothetical protein
MANNPVYGSDRGPVVLAKSAVPVILVPNGTVATNGTITLGTALLTIYANAWIYLPAGAVVGGLAGLYLCQFSSTTVGQVFTNYFAAANAGPQFVPTVIGNPLLVVGSNSAYTQTTGSNVNLASVLLPAGSMGVNGSLRIHLAHTCNNTAGNKIGSIYMPSSTLLWTQTMTTTTYYEAQVDVRNRGIQNSQIISKAAGFGLGAVAWASSQLTAVNTAVDNMILLTGQLATATDALVLEDFSVEVLPMLS